jgi:hypothetical protein
MSDVSACGSRSTHFTREDEDDLRKEPTTSAILDKTRRDANVGGPRVDVRGDDKTWRETKMEQRDFHPSNVIPLAHAGVDGVHIAEIPWVEAATAEGAGASVGAGLVIGGAAAGLALGIHEWLEAHHKGDEQRTALAKDELHVAMLTQLKLPEGYKTEQLAERAQAGRAAQSTAQKMATPFATIDKPLVAVMQHHADLGTRAARDFIESGSSKEKFLAAHPAIADFYAKDPAFHVGFDSLVWARSEKAPPGLYKETLASVEARDCRYAQTHVSVKL